MSVQNYEDLCLHLGHEIVCVGYGSRTENRDGRREANRPVQYEYENIAIECLDCNVVLIDFDK